MIDISISSVFAVIEPIQVIVISPSIGVAALHMVWNKTHIKIQLFPDIL